MAIVVFDGQPSGIGSDLDGSAKWRSSGFEGEAAVRRVLQ